MFVVTITYTASPEEITVQRPGHIEWLKAAFARGSMQMAGSKSTRDGGILITTHADRPSLEAELGRDPYRIHDVATHDVVEFDATMTA